jgi:hypothetical protein
MSMVEAKFGSLKDVKPHEFAVRFVFGGLCTVAAGFIAARQGPAVGGLFLAFPAIFPAGVSLLEKHEKRKMGKAGLDGTNQGRAAASVDSVGASIGCIGLIGFALTLWLGLPNNNAYAMIALAAVVWFAVSAALWFLRKTRWRRRVRQILHRTE